MKARFAQVIGRKFEVILENKQRIEICRCGPGDEIKWDRAEVEATYGEIEGTVTSRIYDTPSGRLEPGCLYWNDWYPENMYWDNHKGPQLMAMLPNGWHWNIDSRASNCTLKEDRSHRCWCRHGAPPNITVDKNGCTCSAGAGSILGGDWHGFLQNGEFIKC